MCSPKLAVLLFKFLFLYVIVLVVVGVIKEFLFLRSEQAKYLNLVLLLIKTRELENILTFFRAEGKGLYEKAENIFSDDKELLKEILVIAKVRNKAMHGDAKIINIIEILAKVKQVKKSFLSYIPILRRITDKIAYFIIYATSIYLTYILYTHYTHDIGKLLLSFIISYIFLKTNFRSRNYFLIVFLILVYSILLIYENGKYLYIVVNRLQDAF